MQYGVGDVDLAVTATGASSVQVPEHVFDASSHVAGAARAAATQCHAPVSRALHQYHVTRTSTVANEVLSLAVICRTGAHRFLYETQRVPKNKHFDFW